MKLVMVVVAAFAVSLAGAAGFVAMQGGGAETSEPTESPVNVDSTVADSHAAAADTGATQASHEAVPTAGADDQEADPQQEDETTHASDTASEHATDTVSPVVARPIIPPQARTGALQTAVMLSPAEEIEQQQQAYRQVARILSNMRESDVAQILAHIQDEDVEGILRQLTARDAAKLLSELPAERAARLSKRLMSPAAQAGGTR